jgi:hypothetical protein
MVSAHVARPIIDGSIVTDERLSSRGRQHNVPLVGSNAEEGGANTISADYPLNRESFEGLFERYVNLIRPGPRSRRRSPS